MPVLTSDRVHVHTHVMDILRKRRISIKENTLVYFLSRAVNAYASDGERGLNRYLTEQFYTMYNGVDDVDSKVKRKKSGKILVPQGKRVYNVCGPITDSAIRERLYSYFQGQYYVNTLAEDGEQRETLELCEDSAGFFVFVPSCMDLQAMRQRVKIILAGNLLDA